MRLFTSLLPNLIVVKSQFNQLDSNHKRTCSSLQHSSKELTIEIKPEEYNVVANLPNQVEYD